MVIPTGFNSQVALELGALINQAYTQLEDVEKKHLWQLASPYQLVDQFYYTEQEKPLLFGSVRKTVPFGFIATKGNTLYIVFRGTSTPLEWFRDAQLKQVDFLQNWGKTTSGFSKIYTALSPTILQALDNLTPGTIFITGHSLGGALANLCAADLLARTSRRPNLYTFASPRTGDPVFARSFQASAGAAYRIFNTEDIVTAVPVSTLKLGDFVQLPITELGLLTMRKFLGGLPEELFEHIGQPISFTVNKGNIGDNHGMATYSEALKQMSGT